MPKAPFLACEAKHRIFDSMHEPESLDGQTCQHADHPVHAPPAHPEEVRERVVRRGRKHVVVGVELVGEDVLQKEPNERHRGVDEPKERIYCALSRSDANEETRDWCGGPRRPERQESQSLLQERPRQRQEPMPRVRQHHAHDVVHEKALGRELGRSVHSGGAEVEWSA